jgi:hypothetical protein
VLSSERNESTRRSTRDLRTISTQNHDDLLEPDACLACTHMSTFICFVDNGLDLSNPPRRLGDYCTKTPCYLHIIHPATPTLSIPSTHIWASITPPHQRDTSISARTLTASACHLSQITLPPSFGPRERVNLAAALLITRRRFHLPITPLYQPAYGLGYFTAHNRAL